MALNIAEIMPGDLAELCCDESADVEEGSQGWWIAVSELVFWILFASTEPAKEEIDSMAGRIGAPTEAVLTVLERFRDNGILQSDGELRVEQCEDDFEATVVVCLIAMCGADIVERIEITASGTRKRRHFANEQEQLDAQR
ncbi:MAG: hypothetical protein ACYS21_20470, partial [Planctomycetota bacterium]